MTARSWPSFRIDSCDCPLPCTKTARAPRGCAGTSSTDDVPGSDTAYAAVPDEVRDSARGMGMSELQVLRRVELPMAVPLLMAGVRTASVQVVATATIAAFVGAGGLGRFIIDGRAIFDNTQIFAGAALVALLSLATEVALGAAQRWLTPRGMRADVVSARAAAVAATTTQQRKALV